jgi:hypothetical protein
VRDSWYEQGFGSSTAVGLVDAVLPRFPSVDRMQRQIRFAHARHRQKWWLRFPGVDDNSTLRVSDGGAEWDCLGLLKKSSTKLALLIRSAL